MKDWGLPKFFADAVLFHEIPESADFSADSRSARLVRCIHLGVRMSDLCFMPQSGRAMEFMNLLSLARNLGIGGDDFVKLGDQMRRELKDWSALLDIKSNEMQPFSELVIGTQSAAALAAEPRTALNVLVVDSDPTVCLLLQKLLTAVGHIVHVAHNADEGLAQAQRYQPRIVMTDLRIARQGGLQFIKNLRKAESGHAMYIIALSVEGDERLAEALALGADDYVMKPVEGNQVRARLLAGMRFIGTL